MTLNMELAAFRACMMDRVGPAGRQQVREAERQVMAADLASQAPQVGDIAPDFTLRDQSGGLVSLYDTLRHGPVILTFYRGSWCPFCMTMLRALQRSVAEVTAIPASILAVCSQEPSTTQVTAQTHGLSFPLLADALGTVSRQWSLMYELPESLHALYEKLGHALPSLNACGTWAVPLTAGYVIAPDRRVAHAHLDPRVHIRMEPIEAVAVARAVGAMQPAS